MGWLAVGQRRQVQIRGPSDSDNRYLKLVVIKVNGV